MRFKDKTILASDITPRDIFENVVAGFAAVSADPVQNVKRMAARKKAAELGIEIEDGFHHHCL